MLRYGIANRAVRSTRNTYLCSKEEGQEKLAYRMCGLSSVEHLGKSKPLGPQGVLCCVWCGDVVALNGPR